MNNEPVAWMALNELNGSYNTFTNDQKQRLLPHVSQCYGKWIPLYTHPVELTDEEITEQANHLADGWFSDKFEKGIFITEEKLVDLVKAILRKAQKK